MKLKKRLNYWVNDIYNIMNKKLKIELKYWDHTCGDGCCYSWGTAIKVNGEEIEGG